MRVPVVFGCLLLCWRPLCTHSNPIRIDKILIGSAKAGGLVKVPAWVPLSFFFNGAVYVAWVTKATINPALLLYKTSESSSHVVKLYCKLVKVGDKILTIGQALWIDTSCLRSHWRLRKTTSGCNGALTKTHFTNFPIQQHTMSGQGS